MIALRPFVPADLIGFDVQPGQLGECPDVEDLAVRIVRRGGEAITVVGGDGRPKMIGGVVAQEDVGAAWAVLAADAGRWMLELTRATRHYFAGVDCATLVTTIDMNCPSFPRWARMLGFEDRGMVQWQRDPAQHLFVRDQ